MTELQKSIISLKSQGYSHNKISTELNCSKSTVSYHLNSDAKIKTRDRQRKFRANSHPYYNKLSSFKSETKPTKLTTKQKDCAEKLIYVKIYDFHNIKGAKIKTEPTFTIDDVINKFGENPKCYLTGKIIDIYKPRTYHFDHIIPRSKGGDNSLDNLGICSKEANLAKGNLTLDEFVSLCKTISNKWS